MTLHVLASIGPLVVNPDFIRTTRTLNVPLALDEIVNIGTEHRFTIPEHDSPPKF